MSKEKTEYRFSVHAAPAVINQVIQNYLAANQYPVCADTKAKCQLLFLQ